MLPVKTKFFIVLTMLSVFITTLSLSVTADDDDEEEEQGPTIISREMAEKIGIGIEVTGPGTLQPTIKTYGKLVTAPEQVSHVRARFAGIITSVHANVGDSVKRGTLLAEVESNESLKKYPINAPIDGVVVSRHANVGELTQNQGLFEIANFDSLWAELRIFPSQKTQISAGLPVFIVLDQQRVEATISHLMPARDGGPYFIARVAVKNSAGQLSPGLMAEGHIVTDSISVPLAVKNEALQTMDGDTGIFILEGETYEFKPLILGRSDGLVSEVLAGISQGAEYVVENSYLIKADMKKSTAVDDDD